MEGPGPGLGPRGHEVRMTRRGSGLASLSAAALLLCAPASAERPLEAKHIKSGRSSPRWERVVIRDEKSWTEHWKDVDQANGSCMRPRRIADIPTVDFKRYTAIVASEGPRNHTTYSLAITGVVDAGDRVEVTVSQNNSRGFAGMAVVFPQDIVLIDKTDKPVTFVETGNDAAGRPKRVPPSSSDYRRGVARIEGSAKLQAVLRKAAGNISCVTVAGGSQNLSAKAYAAFPGPGPGGVCRGDISAKIPVEGVPLFDRPEELAALPRALEQLLSYRMIPGLVNHAKALGCAYSLQTGSIAFELFMPAPDPEDDMRQSQAMARRKNTWLILYSLSTDRVVYQAPDRRTAAPARKNAAAADDPGRRSEVERLKGVIRDRNKER